MAAPSNTISIVGIERHAPIAERWKDADAVPGRPPQEIEDVLHVGFVERSGGFVVAGDPGIGLAAADDEDPDRVIAVLAQGPEHRFGLCGIVMRLGGLGIGVERGVVAPQAHVVESLDEDRFPGSGVNKPRPVLTRLNGDALKRLERLSRRDRCGGGERSYQQPLHCVVSNHGQTSSMRTAMEPGRNCRDYHNSTT